MCRPATGVVVFGGVSKLQVPARDIVTLITPVFDLQRGDDRRFRALRRLRSDGFCLWRRASVRDYDGHRGFPSRKVDPLGSR